MDYFIAIILWLILLLDIPIEHDFVAPPLIVLKCCAGAE